MEAFMLKPATFLAAVLAVAAFASNADAHGMGNFYASPFFRNQGRQPAEPHCAKDRLRFEEALEMQRERRLQAMRAQRAEAAAEAAAARRARLLAIERKKAVAAKQSLASADAPATTVTPKSDMLPANQTGSKTTTAPVTTGSLKTAAVEQPVTTAKTVSADTAEVCRKYSPAANGLVEVPCN
jgi:hypothetical protein